jgi:hypothetical protein
LITNCNAASLGRAHLFWDLPAFGLFQLHAAGPKGAIMGIVDGQGNTETGDWVSDGMVFSLTAIDGTELASTTAHVSCVPMSPMVGAALAAGSYFPLDIGDEWVYRVDNRAGTSLYQTRRVERAQNVNGRTYFVVSFRFSAADSQTTEVLYRSDAQGRVYYLDFSGAEQLLLDPSGKDPSALERVLANSGDQLSYSRPGLIDESGFYKRGIGLTSSSSNMLSGSSGGFYESYTLVYAQIAGNLVFAAPVSGLELSAEARDLDVTGHKVTNCAVPCYFVACNLVPSTDPPGTYKPCFQARVRLRESLASFATAGRQARTVSMDLLDNNGQAVSSASSTVEISFEQPEAVLAQSIGLPMIPGSYRLRAKVMDANNVETDSAVLWMRVR